jgi:GNAT superfamily N-acetyltransferase
MTIRLLNPDHLEFTTSPVTADIDFLTQKINEESTDFGLATPFAFFMRDERGNLIAGANGSVIFGCIYTDQLWVDKNYRRSGLGKKLMDHVHEYGRKAGCRIATVNTMSFQSGKDFYEKLGYSVDFECFGYKQNSSCLFMRKEL